MVFIGMSHTTENEKAGRDAAREVKKQFTNQKPISWVLAFCGGRHDPDVVLRGIRSELGDIEIYGGSAVGIISSTQQRHTGYECGIIAFQEPFPKPHVVHAGNMKESEFEAGRNLGIGLNKIAVPGDTVMLFYDNTRSGPPPVLHVASELLDGIYTELDNDDLHILGAGLVGDFTFSPSFIFDGNKMVKHSAVAIVIPREFLQPHTTIMHGCTPISSFYKITKIDGPVLYELDGRPVTEIISDNLGIESTKLPEMTQSLLLTVGKKYGDLYAPFDERMYVNRLIVDSDLEKGSVTLFEADFKQGDTIQIMSRDNLQMVESVQKGTALLFDSINYEKKHVQFAFYIDCAGRASSFSGSETEEAAIIAERIGDKMEFLGFYSGVEIAPFLGRSRPLDWTGILTVFTTNKSND